jgi:DNA repair protein RadA/Sms
VPQVTPLREVRHSEEARVPTGIGEFDRVLGGGLVEGAVVLVGGDPGIGKSTLLLQALAQMGSTLPGLYVTGEESLAQVAGRAVRLGLPIDGLHALAETGIERILEQAVAHRPKVIVADSVQTLWTESIAAAPGSVSQVRESAARLVRYAKETGTSVFLVGHVTKEGGIAGPRVLEHMVDAVLYFEGESWQSLPRAARVQEPLRRGERTRRVRDGREGPARSAQSLAIFLSGGSTAQPGSAVMVTREARGPCWSKCRRSSMPRRCPTRAASRSGLEQNRLAMLLAVLHRHGGVGVGDQDVFVNVVGGIRLQETAADLPVLLAVLSSLRDRPLPEKTVAFGEVGLSGEIRPVPNGEERLKGSGDARVQARDRAEGKRAESRRVQGLEVIAVERLGDALAAAN